MNLILFTPEEAGRPLSALDPRAIHLKTILKLQPGDSLDAGVLGGKKGRLSITSIQADFLTFEGWDFQEPAPRPYPVSLIIGTPRPPTARRLLKDLTALGAGELHFVSTDLGEKSYLQSTLWQNNEYQQHLWEGAQQAETTHIPLVFRHTSLSKALEAQNPANDIIAFDPGGPLPTRGMREAPCVLCIGPERGWSERERELLTKRRVAWVGLGPRILRTETACPLALGLILVDRFWA